jgi:hypothetical protein
MDGQSVKTTERGHKRVKGRKRHILVDTLRLLAVLQLSKSAGIGSARLACFNLLGQPKQLSDEPDLSPNIIAPHPPNLPLPNHVHRLIALNGSPGRVKFPEALLGVDPAFDRPMVLFDDVVQVLDRSMAAWAAQCPFLLN